MAKTREFFNALKECIRKIENSLGLEVTNRLITELRTSINPTDNLIALSTKLNDFADKASRAEVGAGDNISEIKVGYIDKLERLAVNQHNAIIRGRFTERLHQSKSPTVKIMNALDEVMFERGMPVVATEETGRDTVQGYFQSRR